MEQRAEQDTASFLLTFPTPQPARALAGTHLPLLGGDSCMEGSPAAGWAAVGGLQPQAHADPAHQAVGRVLCRDWGSAVPGHRSGSV